MKMYEITRTLQEMMAQAPSEEVPASERVVPVQWLPGCVRWKKPLDIIKTDVLIIRMNMNLSYAGGTVS